MTMFIPLFDAIARRQPGHAAVLTDGAETVTYAALQARAQSIAARLPPGAPGRIVALNIEKSADYIAAMLGCWYARAAFLPLDPAMPAARRQLILDEAQPVCVLTAQSLRTLPDRAFTALPADAADLAYVIYTSGSTGTPKGVMVPHAGLCHVLLAQIDLFQLSPQSRSLFYLSTMFDASVSDIGTALLAGATLCIERVGKLETAAQLAEIIAARQIVYADLPPALLQLLDPRRMPACLATICIGGEACPPAVVRDWAATRRIVCVYGPTEATICTSASVCDAKTWTAPLIGTPLPGVEYHIFDRRLQPAADGELYIGGENLALGYLARAQLTAEKFIQHDGRRLYKTGDHVRRTQDGIEFLGRIDRQFKWRGQLVEPEEIEQQLRRLPGISRAAVLRAVHHGQEKLVAHIETAAPLPATEMQTQLAAQLPAWMVPTAFVPHHRLPLTATGKVNMAALATYEEAPQDNSAAFTATTPTEQKLLACWQRVLKREAVPAHLPFSALGGDSFALLQLILEAETQGLTLSPAFLTRHRTLAAQARHLTDITPEGDAMPAADLRARISTQFPLPPANKTAPAQPPRRLLLTGGTGFLGGHLLRRLLEQTDLHIAALVRAGDEASGWQRLGLAPQWRKRVDILCGDAAAENLGLDDGQWQHLAQGTDAILHCAAVVNMALPHAALEDANVRPLHSLLRLAAEGPPKHIHYASTLSVFVATDRNHGVALESDALDDTKTVYGGYAQSKWAAEVLLQQAMRQGQPASIYRLGLVTGDSRTGASSSHDFLRTFLQGLIALGCVPACADELLVDATPVDYAADMMLAAMLSGRGGGLHIANHRGFSLLQIVAALRRHGHALRELPPQAWQDHVNARAAKRPLSPEEAAAVMGLCRAAPAPAFARHRAMDLFQATGVMFDMRALQEAAGSAYRAPPSADDALLDLYLRSFQLSRAA